MEGAYALAFIFTTLCSFFIIVLVSKTSRGVVECTELFLSGDLQRSVLAHAPFLQKIVMNVNNAKAIKIILVSVRSNAIPRSVRILCRCAQSV